MCSYDDAKNVMDSKQERVLVVSLDNIISNSILDIGQSVHAQKLRTQKHLTKVDRLKNPEIRPGAAPKEFEYIVAASLDYTCFVFLMDMEWSRVGHEN